LNFQNVLGEGMKDSEEQIVHELKKLNATLVRMENSNEEINKKLGRLNDKLLSIERIYESEFYYDVEDEDTRKKIVWTQLAMIVQSLKRIESSLVGIKY
jgi:hypothetical protein